MRGEPGDGLWSDEPGLPMLALERGLRADRRRDASSGARRLAVAPRGLARPRRGRRRGRRRARSATRATAAIVGPAIGPCCYEVGPEVSARFDADLTASGILDLWAAAERALAARGRRARRARRPVHALQPGALLLASAQRLRRGASGGDRCSRRLRSARATSGVRAEVGAGRDGRRGDEVRRRSRRWRSLAEAGIEVVGENRAQDLEAKHAVYGDAFRWHFIGRLQSNKVKVVNRTLRARPLARLAFGRASGSRSRRSCR